ncbi:hypothetical protein [Anaeromicrobium sediminis]|uniref:ArnR1-like winged helix-turn-helix domain-containing protein n=1 Tax=Anaeromicrobium sediminis TaxID=1478221 RepID=A0A267MNB2_9FIRM|nr:hypothetical protein [Anaeromicrobium sediminis]PAB61026.1 hypothetical protein CCE28_00930 [Anaeromicrobium sediminis]
MSPKQEDIFLHLYAKFKPIDKFFAVKILEDLIIKGELYIEEIYLIFSNRKKAKIRKIIDELYKNHLIQETDKNNKKIYKITNSGEQLIMESYKNHPFF